METSPEAATQSKTQWRPRYPETFGLEPLTYEREIPQVIRDLGEALHRFEREGGDDDIREEFEGIYPEQDLDKDIELVHRRERTFDAEDDFRSRKFRIYALALEYIVADTSHVWFPDCSIWKATKFDDYQHYTDLFMEVPTSQGDPVTLSLDVASGGENSGYKLGKIYEQYDLGRFQYVKYFMSDTDPDRPRGGALLPRFVLGASQSGIASLARAYRNYLRAPEGQKEVELHRLKYHHLAGQLYETLIIQLDQAYTRVRRKHRSTPQSDRTAYETLRERMTALQSAKRELQKRYDLWKEERGELLRRDRDFAAGDRELANDVLEAVRAAA